jgi:hypothetical protein
MIAQRDTYPGLGRYPTTVWETGVAFEDTYRVHLPDTAYAPDVGFIQVGLYVPGGERLRTADGRDAIRLAPVRVLSTPGDFPNPMHQDFANRIALIGYSLDRRVAHPGESIRLTLYWRALAEVEADYHVFAHVLGGEDQVWGRSDGWPAGSRTSTWSAGEVIRDERVLWLDERTPPRSYELEIGLYLPGEAPLPVVAEDGHWLAQRVLLSQVRVSDG